MRKKSPKIGGCIMIIMYYYVIFYSFHNMFPCLWFAILTHGMAFFFIPGCSRSNFRSDVVAKSPRVDAPLRHRCIRQRRTWRTGRNPGGNMQQNHRTSTKMSYSMREIWWNMYVIYCNIGSYNIPGGFLSHGGHTKSSKSLDQFWNLWWGYIVRNQG
jgi:hypothetical protein